MHTTIKERLLIDAKENPHKHNKNAIDMVLELSDEEKKALLEKIREREKDRANRE